MRLTSIISISMITIPLFCISCGTAPPAHPSESPIHGNAAQGEGPGQTNLQSSPTTDIRVDGFGEPVSSSALSRAVEALEATKGRPLDVSQPDSAGQTLLHKAAIVGRADLAQRLIALGADPSAKNSFGYTPLDLIMIGGTKGQANEVTRILLAAGGKYCVFAQY